MTRALGTQTLLILLAAPAVLCGQPSLTCTPASGTVQTYGWSIVCTESGTTAVASVRQYVDGRLENVLTGRDHGLWSGRILNVTITDERALAYYAEAYDANLNLLATSPTYTLRIDNVGLNAVTSCSDAGGAVANGGTTTAANAPLTCTMPSGGSAGSLAPSAYSPLVAIDGLPQTNPFGGNPITQGQGFLYALNSAIDYTNNALVVPIIQVAQGDQVYIYGCTQGFVGSACTGQTPYAGGSSMAGQTVYAIPKVFGGVLELQIANSYANAMAGTAMTLTNPGGVAIGTEYTVVIVNGSGVGMSSWLWSQRVANFVVNGLTANGAGVISPRFLDGLHRITNTLQLPSNNSQHTVTFTAPASAINTATGMVAVTNVPLMQDAQTNVSSAVTVNPALSGWSGTMYAVLTDANDFCLASSQANATAGTCLTGLGTPSGTYTFTTTISERFYDGNSGNTQPMGQDVQWINFSSGSTYMCELMLASDFIVLAPGETFSLAPYGLNCDQSTRALTASSLLYGTSNSAVATVSSSGTVTAVGTGDAMLSVIDNAHDRVRNPVVLVQSDHAHYPCFTVGHGISQTFAFTGGNCVYLVSPFNTSYLFITSSGGLAANIMRNIGFNSIGGGIVPQLWDGTLGSMSYSTVMSAYWNNCPTYPSNCSAYSLGMQVGRLQSQWQNAWFSYYGTVTELGVCTIAYAMQQNPWMQQVWGQMISDIAPYTTVLEPVDEQTGSCFSTFHNGTSVLNMVSSTANGDDGTGHPGGLTQIVVSNGTATASFQSFYNPLSTGNLIHSEISGASTANLNGPMTVASIAPVHNGFPSAPGNPLGPYITSFTFPTLASNGTYNYTTDPNLQINWHIGYDGFPSALDTDGYRMLTWGVSGTATISGANSAGSATLTATTGTFPTVYPTGGGGYNLIYVGGAALGFTRTSPTTGTVFPLAGSGVAATNQTGVSWSTGPTSYTVTNSGNLVQISWPGHPLTNGYEIMLGNGYSGSTPNACATAGLAGWYRADVQDANNINAIPLATITGLTYPYTVNSSNDPNCQINERTRLVNDYYLRLTHTWVTGTASLACYPGCNRMPTGGSQTGGGTPISWQEGYPIPAVSDFVPQNRTYGNNDRYGESFFNLRYVDQGGVGQYMNFLIDGNSLRSRWSNYAVMPVMAETQLTQGCRHNGLPYPALYCRTDIPGADQYEQVTSRPEVWASAMVNVIGGKENVGGMKPYPGNQFANALSGMILKPYGSGNAGSYYQDSPDFTEKTTHSDWIAAFASAAGTAQRNAKCLLNPLKTTPDAGRLGLLETVSHHVPGGDNCTVLMNWSERDEPFRLDLSLINQGGLMWEFVSSAWGTTVQSIAPTNLLTGTVKHGSSIWIVSQPSGAAPEVPSVSIPVTPLLAAVSGAASLTVRVKHYRDDLLFNVTNCGSSGMCSVLVDARAVGAWMQYVYLNSNGQVIRQSDWEWQTPL